MRVIKLNKDDPDMQTEEDVRWFFEKYLPHALMLCDS